MTSQQLYLSQVLNKPVTDASGQLLGRLWDLTVSPDEEFPALSGHWRTGQRTRHRVTAVVPPALSRAQGCLYPVPGFK